MNNLGSTRLLRGTAPATNPTTNDNNNPRRLTRVTRRVNAHTPSKGSSASVQERDAGGCTQDSPGEADEATLAEHEREYARTGVSKCLKNRVLFDTVLRSHHNGVCDQYDHHSNAHEAEPARERDQVEEVGERAGVMRLLGLRFRRHFEPLFDLRVDLLGHARGLVGICNRHLKESRVVLVVGAGIADQCQVRVDDVFFSTASDAKIPATYTIPATVTTDRVSVHATCNPPADERDVRAGLEAPGPGEERKTWTNRGSSLIHR